MGIGGAVIFLLGIGVSWFAWRGFGFWCLTRIPHRTFWHWWNSAWLVFFVVPLVLMVLVGEVADLVISLGWMFAVAVVALVTSVWQLRLLRKLARFRREVATTFGKESADALTRLDEIVMEAATPNPDEVFAAELSEIFAQRGGEAED